MHGASTENMDMEMGDGLPAVGTVIDYDPVAVITKPLLTRDSGGGQEEGS